MARSKTPLADRLRERITVIKGGILIGDDITELESIAQEIEDLEYQYLEQGELDG